MNIAKKIIQLRKERHINQTQLANAVGVSQQTITKWETGRSEPKSSALRAIADYFNVSADYLLGRKYPNNLNNLLSNKQIAIARAIDPNLSIDELKAMIKIIHATQEFGTARKATLINKLIQNK